MAFATAASVCARTPACRSTAAVAASPRAPPRSRPTRERALGALSTPPNPPPPPSPRTLTPANRTSALRAPSVPGFTPRSAAANTHSAAARFASDVCFPFPLSSAQIASSENGATVPRDSAPRAPRERASNARGGVRVLVLDRGVTRREDLVEVVEAAAPANAQTVARSFAPALRRDAVHSRASAQLRRIRDGRIARTRRREGGGGGCPSN